jgi:uncharacterized protein (TIGR03437 family)
MTRLVARLLNVGLIAYASLYTSTALQGQTGSLALASGSVAAGGAITLNLNWAAPATNVPAGLEWAFTYAPGNIASVSSVAAGPTLAASGKTLNCNATTGTVICLATGMNANPIGSGVIATISVVLPPTIASSIPISIGNLVAVLADGTSATVTGSGGIITVLQPLPTISSLLPATALAGGLSFTLTVNGAGFTPASVVNWNGVARTTTFVSATQLQVNVTALDIILAILAQVTVTNPAPGGGTSGSAAFTVSATNAVPTISSLAPANATAGAAAFTLTVTGGGFLNSSVVRWNGTSRTTTFVSATQLQAAITAADIATAGSGQVTVFSPAPGGGTSGNSAFTITATNLVPTISSLAPANATAGAAAFTLTVNGTGFLNGSVVRWNGTSRTTTFASATQLQAAITAADIATAGSGQVTVFNPTPGGGTSGNLAFTITATNPMPTISSLLPASATAGTAAFALTVNGTGFLNGSVVNWNGTSRGTAFVSATQLLAAITAADIAAVGTGQVTVSNPAPGGGTSGTSAFTITGANPIPTISSLAPASATAGAAAFTLTVNGTGFLNGSVVRWNGTSRTTTFVSATQLQAAITAADIATAGSGQVTVFNPTPGGGTSGSSAFTINSSTSTTATAAFVKTDTTTAGNWKGTYGADGSNIIGDTVSYPSYVTVTASGNFPATWASSTSDKRALQKVNSTTDRIAATWYTTGAMTVDLNFKDASSHQVALYALDWDAGGARSERVDILDVNNNLLDTRSLTSFAGGLYAVWNFTGHVVIRITNTSAVNAVVAGLLFAPGAANTVPNAPATFIKTDTTTAGNWKGTYGADGYNIIGDTVSYPAYVTVTASGNSPATWAGSTSDARALQKVNSTTDRIAATWYAPGAMTIDLNFKDANSHQVALYALDWDAGGARSERVDILDVNNNVLDTRSLTSFAGGVYAVWNFTGHVVIRITNTSPINAVVAGLLFAPGAAGTAPNAPATFVKTDVTSAGNWKGTYGADGYNIIGDTVTYPAYVAVTPTGYSPATWAGSTSDTRALQKVNSTTDRIAATWYATGAMTIDLNFKDANSHQVALYALDWDAGGARSERVDILDVNNNVLDTRTLTHFNGGAYLVWNFTGHVIIRITNTSLINAVVSGLLFGPVGASPSPNITTASVKTGTTAFGTRKGVDGLSCSPRTVNAGGKATCELRMPVSTVPQQFQLASNSAQVQLPAAVVSRSNQGSLTFQVSTDPTAKSELAVVTATLGDSQVQDKITVTSSGQPVLTAPRTHIAKLGDRLAFLVTAIDPNGLPLQLAIDGTPRGASFDSASGRFEWTPSASQEGTHRVAFVATNSARQSSTAQVTIDVDSGRPVLTPSEQSACSPGSVATLAGRWLAVSGDMLSDASGSSMDLGGTKVKVNGQSVPVLFASESAVNFLCPILNPGEPVSVAVETASGVIDVLATTMQEASPTILSLDGSDENQGLISFARSSDIAMGRNYRIPAHPAQPGDQILIWATGLGPIPEAASALSVKLGDVYAVVESVQALVGHAGVYAIQARIPGSTAFGDSVSVQLEVTGSSRAFKSNSVTLAVEAVRQ